MEAAIEPPDDAVTDGYESDAASRSSAYTASTTSVQHVCENGRRYCVYKGGTQYPIPDDDWEQERQDMKHLMMLELTNGELFLAPIGNNPQKILDIGTGTGIWAIDGWCSLFTFQLPHSNLTKSPIPFPVQL